MSVPADEGPLGVDLAREDDVPFLAGEGGALFARSHAGALLPEDIRHYLDDAFNPERLLRHLRRSDNIFLVARAGASYAGYARLVDGPRSAFIDSADSIELRRFYVLEDWHGRGVAKLLMQHVASIASDRKYRSIWLHVWEQNARAIRFYEKSGFTVAGREDSPYRSSSPMALVMVRLL